MGIGGGRLVAATVCVRGRKALRVLREGYEQ